MTLESRLLPQFERFGEYQIVGAKGNYVSLKNISSGETRKYLDFNSGCWNVPLGHNNPEINRFLQEGYYANPFGFSNPHAEKYARELCSLTNTTNVVFSTSGSEAVDIALRLAWQSHAQNNLCERDIKYILSIKGGYHGSTGLAMYVDGYLNYDAYLPIVTNKYPKDHFSIKLPDPRKWKGNIGNKINEIIKGREHSIAAIVFEPVMGVRGVVPLPNDYIDAFIELSDKYEVTLIADEVTTGFGRTGKMFGYEHYGINPDIICLAKAITNGTIPFAATVFNDKVKQGVEDSQPEDYGKFLYGHTLSAQPAGCMIASKVIDIIEKDDLVSRVREKGEYLREGLQNLRDKKFVRDIRGRGFFNSVEVLDSDLAKQIINELLKRDIFMKNDGNSLTIAPPYTLTDDEMNYFIEQFTEVLKTHS